MSFHALLCYKAHRPVFGKQHSNEVDIKKMGLRTCIQSSTLRNVLLLQIKSSVVEWNSHIF